MTKYSIVLPCFNEGDNLPTLVDRFHKFTEEWDFELILVDNGSTDHTSSIIDQLLEDERNSFIIPHKIGKNQGYGYGIRSGLNAACGDILGFTHADSQTPPEDVFRAFNLYVKLSEEGKDVIVQGEREGRANEHLTTRGLSMVTRILTGVKAPDVNGQPKVFGKELLDHMHVEVNNFAFDPYVLTVAKNLGWSIQTISVDFRKRKHGISKSSYNICMKLRTIAEFIYTIFRFSRIR